MSTVGTQAPDFTLHNTKREAITLSALRGAPVVLAFYPAAFTGGCEKELCSFRDVLADFNKMGAKVLGISVDAPFSNAAFAEKTSLTFDLLSDYTRAAVTAYDIALDDFAGMTGYTAAKRAVFVIDGEGVIRYRWVAPNPGVQPDFAEVQAEAAKLGSAAS